MTFDPNDCGLANGNFFGLPFSPEDAQLIIVPVPWDVTTSYSAGTSRAPENILNASLQVDLYDLDYNNSWQKGIATIGINKTIKKQGKLLREEAEKVIRHLEEGGDLKDAKHLGRLNKINEASSQLNSWVYAECWQILAENKIPAVLGGDHSVPLGLIQALAEKNDSFGILQIDAHADLRESYEGFTYSHASIMHNAINFKSVDCLVQVGVRDLCEEEFNMTFRENMIHCFDDNLISFNLLNGKSWDKQCREMIALLPQKVYISFDIDGLEPSLCPGTGTPVPGGLTFNQAVYLLRCIHESGKSIIGFDLCEVGAGKMDAITGARTLFKLCSLALASQKA